MKKFSIYHTENLSYEFLDYLYSFYKNTNNELLQNIEVKSTRDLKYNKINANSNIIVFGNDFINSNDFSIITTQLLRESKIILNRLIPYKKDNKIRIYLVKPNKFFTVNLKKKGVKLLIPKILKNNSILYSYLQHLSYLYNKNIKFIFVELEKSKQQLIDYQDFYYFLTDLYS